jgi:hypothetical protein
MNLGIFDKTDAKLYRFAVLGYCLGASGLTIVLAAISAAGVI